jgi:hypothetical protein
LRRLSPFDIIRAIIKKQLASEATARNRIIRNRKVGWIRRLFTMWLKLASSDEDVLKHRTPRRCKFTELFRGRRLLYLLVLVTCICDLVYLFYAYQRQSNDNIYPAQKPLKAKPTKTHSPIENTAQPIQPTPIAPNPKEIPVEFVPLEKQPPVNLRSATQMVFEDQSDHPEFAFQSLVQRVMTADKLSESIEAVVTHFLAEQIDMEGRSKNFNQGIMGKLARDARIHRNLYQFWFHLRLQQSVNLTQIEGFKQLETRIHSLEKKIYPWMKTSVFELYESTLVPFRGPNGENQARGLIYTTGRRHAHYTYLSIQNVRRLGCQLPVTVIYGGEDDLPLVYRQHLESLPGVTTMDLKPFCDWKQIGFGGWSIKPFAILFSPYQYTIFADSDVFWFQNPELYFEDASAHSTGTIFFHDRTLFPDPNSPPKQWFQSFVPYPSDRAKALRMWHTTSIHEQESGVVVVNRSRAYLGLLVSCQMNTQQMRNQEVYSHVHGDKETFWMGYEMIREPYSFYPGFGSVIGFISQLQKDGQTVCGGLLHSDRKGRPVWFNGGVEVDKYTQPDRMVNFTHVLNDFTGVEVTWDFGERSKDGFCMSQHGNPPVPLLPQDITMGKWITSSFLAMKNNASESQFWNGSL